MNNGFSRAKNAKRLIQWSLFAQKLHFLERKINFKEREVWLTSIGHGVGTEVYGKNETFQRPVLVLKKFNNQRFLGIPLTSNSKYTGTFTVSTFFRNKMGKAMLDQANSYDEKRLLKKMGMLDKPTFEDIIRRFNT